MELFLLVVFSLPLLAACGSSSQPSEMVSAHPPSQMVAAGQSATLSCVIHDDTAGNLGWSYDGTRAILPEPQRYVISSDGQTLTILNVQSSDAGAYCCVLYTQTADLFSNTSTLSICEEASVTVSRYNNDGLVQQNMNLNVIIAGSPDPAVTLQKRSGQSYTDLPTSKFDVLTNGTLVINSLVAEDVGDYRVCVTNGCSDSMQCGLFNLTVFGPPVLIDIQPMTVKRGKDATIICSLVGSYGSDLEIVWRTTDSVLISEGVLRLNNTALQLIVESVTEAVDYQCLARNAMGDAFEVARIDIVDVPSQPRNPSLISSSDDITITWVAPVTDNGKPLTAYYVTIQKQFDATIVERVPIDSASYIVMVCGNITFTVTAENDCGNSTAVTRAFEVECPTAESTETTDTLPVIVAGVVVAVIFVAVTIIVMVLFICWYKRQRRQLETKTSVYSIEAPPMDNGKVNSLKMTVATSPPPFIKRTTSIRQYRSLLEISKENVVLKDTLCDGTHYELCKGLVALPENGNKTHEVMIKKAKGSAPVEEEHNIKEEIKMMSSIGIHENVVGLLRTCLTDSPTYLITEYFAHGDLLGFLRSSRGHYGMYVISPGTGYKTHPCTVQAQDLLKIVTQVASGMNFLAEKKITHRSLCARNVLVGTGLQVKVYNYGQKADNEDIPQNYSKWMAPEMLFDGTADTMSDVWSFAVTLWEIVTIGGSPYPRAHPGQMRELLQTGYRMPKPAHCTDEIYGIMDQCWKHSPSMRPTFATVHKQLDTMCKSKLSYLNSALYNDAEFSQFEDASQLMTAL